MPKANVTIESNLDDAVKTVQNMKGEVPKAADDAATIIAQDWQRNAERVMNINNSVVTGTGIQSLKLTDLGEGKAGVMGASYLEKLDTGTQAHYPDTNNYRFIAAARSYGISRQALAESIAQDGTRPHPWISRTTGRTRKKMPSRVKIELQNAVEESMANF